MIGPYEQAAGTPTIFIAYAIDPANPNPVTVPWAVTSHIDSLLDCSLVSNNVTTCAANRMVSAVLGQDHGGQIHLAAL